MVFSLLKIFNKVEDLKNNRSYIDHNFNEIKSTINLADTFYDNSFYSIKDIPLSFRFSILVARRIYRQIGYKILKKKTLDNYKNSGKIFVSKFEKLILTVLSLFDLFKLFFTNFENHQMEKEHLLIKSSISLNERI